MTWKAGTSQGRARARTVVAFLALTVAAAGCASDTTASGGTSADAASEATETTGVPATGAVSTMAPGDIAETVPSVVPSTLPPVPLDASATFTSGVVASITDVVEVTTEASVPGEVAGPGVAVTVEVVNGTADTIDLGSALLDLVDATGASATPIVGGSEPLAGALAPGAATSGTYVFTLDESLRSDVTIHLSYSAGEPIVAFAGNLD